MNKFLNSVFAFTLAVGLTGCCGEANAASESKISSTAVVDAGFDIYNRFLIGLL